MTEKSDNYPEHVPSADPSLIAALAREAARDEIIRHLAGCPFAKLAIEERLRKIELRFSALVAFMCGSGLIGGTVGASLIKLLTP